jgi:hypothetical protein
MCGHLIGLSGIGGGLCGESSTKLPLAPSGQFSSPP